MEASRNFIFNFLHKKATKIVKKISTHSENNDLIFSTFKKIINFMTLSF